MTRLGILIISCLYSLFVFAEKENVEGRVVSPEEIFEVTTLDSNPTLTKRVLPEYPENLLKNGVQGLVVAVITIDERGKVSKVDIVKSDHELFSKSVKDALSKCEFTIPKVNGKPVKAMFQLTLPFRK